MELWKKLVILTGQAGRGTVQIERTGAGVSVTLNVFGLPDLPYGEYALGVKTGVTAFRREVGSLGRIKSRFALPEADYEAVHFILFRTADEQSVLYGTTSPQKMWEANRMDGLRGGDKDELPKESVAPPPSPQAFQYSQRKIEDFFYDISPTPYADSALAQENYFAYSFRPDAAGGSGTAAGVDAVPKSAAGETDEARASASSPVREKTPSASSLPKFHGVKPFRRAEARPASFFSHTDAPARDEEKRARESIPETEKRPPFVAPTTPPHAARLAQEHMEETEKDPGDELVQELRSLKKASAYTAEQAIAATKTRADYYAGVASKLENLFAHAPAYTPLGDALPGTRWVKVDYDGTGRYYVIGLVGDAPSYIAYGVPGSYGACPAALEGADFVPLYADKPTGEGFWVLFQSARTGEEIPHIRG